MMDPMSQESVISFGTPERRSFLRDLGRDHRLPVLTAVLAAAAAFGSLISEWQTTDLDGQPHALADYRGKVVVLDFWYRACGWCIRAMPQMKQLTDDFQDQSVAILGINSDRDLADARYVIDKMSLNYPTLKNGEGSDQISTLYKIHGWPTLVVIDKKGVLRHVHKGFHDGEEREIEKEIKELL